MNTDILKLLKRYDEWRTAREAIAAREDTRELEFADLADEWAWSDDEAVELTHLLAAALKEATS